MSMQLDERIKNTLKLIIYSTNENISWIDEIITIPGGTEELLKHLDKLDVYLHGLNYSLFYFRLPVNLTTYKSLITKSLSAEDITMMYLFYLKQYPQVAHDFITRFKDKEFDVEASLLDAE